MKTNLKIVGLVLVVTSLFACKKEYTCVCSNPYIDPKGFIIKDTKRSAKQKCKDYETNGKLGSLQTTCNLTK
ncbi:MAG: hypothetical protein H7331_09520 [Bacteroidia bacterium]|nr:hypothetical protein [Bacteroidia bacterium]